MPSPWPTTGTSSVALSAQAEDEDRLPPPPPHRHPPSPSAATLLFLLFHFIHSYSTQRQATLKSITNKVHSFIHSFILVISIAPLQSSTTQRRSRLQHGYCIGVSRRSAQATADKGLAQGHYVAARAGVEPTTLRLKVIVSTKAPPCPTYAN